MADKKPDKKGPPKPSGGGGGSAEGQMIFVAVIAVVIVFVIIPTVLMFFGFAGTYTGVTDNLSERSSSVFTSFVDTVGLISIFLSLLFVMGIIYAKTRHKEITELYNAHLKAIDEIGKLKPIQSSLAPNVLANVATSATVTNTSLNPFEQYMQAKGQDLRSPEHKSTENGVASNNTQSSLGVSQATNPRWIQIEKNMQSHNMSEWRVAILEADILLFDMLSQMGYEGDSIGEILKNVDKANFVTLDDAWKAHRIRNIIAHEGANYELSRNEAERTIRLFKRVFDEFYFV